MKLNMLTGALVAAALACVGGPAGAQHAPGHEALTPRGEFHGDIGRFHEHDWTVWHSGRWYQGDHGGRLGWWWISGGVWYSYPFPVYPWPDPYVPPDLPVPATPPPPTPVNWYYCDPLHAYYPYVESCPQPWRVVPATRP